MERHSTSLVAYFTLAYGLSWAIWAPLWLPALGYEGLPVLPYHHALGAFGPVAAAFMVTAATAGRSGARKLLQRMGAWRGRLGWISVALLGPLALLLVAAGAARLATDAPISLDGIGSSAELPGLGLVGFLLYNVLTFGYGEEVGWRGFALPRLQARHSALGATALLTVGWAGWHAPLFLYRPGYMEMGLAGASGWLLSLVTGAVLLTWLYNESRGSLLVVALFHASVDVAFTSDVSSEVVVSIAGALITFWGIGVVIRAGPSCLARKGKMVWSGEAGDAILAEADRVR